MKKVVSLLVVVSMMLTVCVSGFAAMTSTEMYEALTGVHASNPYGAESGLIDAYKNVSPAQMQAMKVFRDKLIATDYTDASNAVWSVLSETEDAMKAEEIAFVLGMADLITYAQDALDTSSYFKGNPASATSTELKNLLVSNLTTESEAFTNGAYLILNKYSNDLLTKDAFGGLIIDLKDKFLKVIKANITALTAVFTSNDQAAYTALVEDYFIQALAEVIANPAYPEFAVNAVPAMTANGFVDGTDAKNSKFVKWVEDTFEFLGAVDSDVVCVLANTIISSIADIDIVTSNNMRIDPNKAVTIGAEGSVNFTIKTAEEAFKGSSVGYDLNLDLTSWFDLKLIDYEGNAFADAEITYDAVSGTFTLTGKNADRVAKYGVLQLYRNATADQGNDSDTHQLFAEFQVAVSKKSTGGGGGGGGGSTTAKFEITFMADGKVVDHVDVVNGKLVKVPEGPEKDGYNFIGWSVDGETTVDPTTVELSKNTVFYALYKEIPAMDKENHFAYVIGYEDGEFKPEKNITRAEAATIFSRLLIKKIDVNETYTTKFTDVAADAWYFEYVAHMENIGVITGYPDGTFRPDDAITRAEFATMASRFDKLSPAEISFFEDVTAEHWAYNYVESAATKGWIKGYEDGTFKPENNITREETVTIVNRMLERAADKAYVEANKEAIIDYSDIDNTRWSYYDIIEASNSHLFQ